MQCDSQITRFSVSRRKWVHFVISTGLSNWNIARLERPRQKELTFSNFCSWFVFVGFFFICIFFLEPPGIFVRSFGNRVSLQRKWQWSCAEGGPWLRCIKVSAELRFPAFVHIDEVADAMPIYCSSRAGTPSTPEKTFSSWYWNLSLPAPLRRTGFALPSWKQFCLGVLL